MPCPGEQHLFLTSILPEGRLHWKVSAALVEIAQCQADMDEGGGARFPGVLTEKYMKFQQESPYSTNTITYVLVTPKAVALQRGGVVAVNGTDYAVQLAHVLDRTERNKGIHGRRIRSAGDPFWSNKLGSSFPRLLGGQGTDLDEAGRAMLRTVRDRIGGDGKVQQWQELYQGSGGGYAAVRPKADTFDGYGHAVGAVTNALESGHVQEPGRYVPTLGRKLVRDRVSGKYMYLDSSGDVRQAAQEAAARIERDMAGILED